MKVELRRFAGRVSLVMAEHGCVKGVLAVLTRFWNESTWVLQDIRLHPHMRRPSEWFGGSAEDFWASHVASSEEQADTIRAALREFKESIDPSGGVLFEWCTYRGICPGRKASEMGAEPVNHLDASICCTRQEGLDQLAALERFWSEWSPPDGQDLAEAVGSVKIPNLLLQPTSSQLSLELSSKEMLKERLRQ